MGSEGHCQVVSTFFSTTLLGTEMKIDLFQSCGYYWTFQICWHMECSTLMSLSFSILNFSPGIPPLPLAFLVVMLPKTHLTSHSRMSGSRWVTTPSWLSRSSRLFLCSSSMYSFHLFLISFASVKSLPFLSIYHAHPCMKCFFDISNFLEEISILSCSIVSPFIGIVCWRMPSFLSLLFSGTLHSVGYIFPFLLSFHFSSFLSYL